MRFKRIVISTIFILTIFSLFVSAVYADNSGYFLQGFADGFNKGFQMGSQIKQKKEMKWKAEQLKELEKIFEQWEFFSDTVQRLVESGQMTPELGKKFLVLNSLLPMDLQEHGQNLYNGIMFVDKDKVADEKQYFKNIIDTISVTSGQVDSKTFGNLSSLLASNKKALINLIIESDFSYTTPQSELKYNPFENKWEYAPPGSTPKYNSFESKWEFASPEDKTKYNPFEDKWSYEKPNNNLKYNPFQNKWEYAPSGSVL
ncbi:MAG: hypothetical protein FP833_08070, partial [Atribacteria sp.]|nr:hypothetical protein [Candidatus Atribacteria bacterium]